MDKDPQTLILENLKQKAVTKQKAAANTQKAFKTIRKIGRYLAHNLRKSTKDLEVRIPIEYRENGAHQAELRVASDLLVFTLQTNVYTFEPTNPLWKTPRLAKDPSLAFCGIINIYNFLGDSFKFNRLDDHGVLIGRIYINKDNRYMVEGQPPLNTISTSFSDEEVSQRELREVVMTALALALDIDLVAPAFERSRITTVQEIRNNAAYADMKSGKRLGFKMYSDDNIINQK